MTAPRNQLDSLARACHAAMCDARGITAPELIVRSWDDMTDEAHDVLKAGVSMVVDLIQDEPAAPAPELAAAMRETRELRALIGDILDTFHISGDGYRARVGIVQIRKWRDRAGLNRSLPDSAPQTTESIEL